MFISFFPLSFQADEGVKLFSIRRKDLKESVLGENRKHAQEASPIFLIFLPEKEMD